jgi:hypothetical protein
MRTTLLALSTLAIIAACAQDGSTSPASQTRSPDARASRDVTPDGQGQPNTNAKPAGALTTVTQAAGPEVSWDGVNVIYGASVATCPAGAKVVGGGYTMYGVETAILYNAPFGPDSWRVYGVSHASGSVKAYAVCVQ